jgi:hypothetical protein
MARPEVVIDELVVKQVAALSATGASPVAIAEQLGMSRYQVKKIIASGQYAEVIKDIGDEVVKGAKQVIRSKTSELAKEITRVLTERLAENDLEAVKVALKIIGFDNSDDKDKGETNINVILPGQSNEQVIEPEFRTLEETDNEPTDGH